MSVIFNTSGLEELKKAMPKKWSHTISKNVPCSIQTVYNVFAGTCKDEELIEKVINEAIKLKGKKAKKRQALDQKIKEAIS